MVSNLFLKNIKILKFSNSKKIILVIFLLEHYFCDKNLKKFIWENCPNINADKKIIIT